MTTEPMTTEELAVIRGAIERTDLFDEETLPLAFSDRKRLLAEVDRLRAENARLAAQERASGPETPQGHPSEGTGVPGPHGAAQAADLTPAEQAAADALAADSECSWHHGCDAEDCHEPRARAVVAAVRPLIEADALDALAEAATTYGPPSTDHLRGVAFTVRQTRTPVRAWLDRAIELLEDIREARRARIDAEVTTLADPERVYLPDVDE